MSAHRTRTSSWQSVLGIIAVVVSVLQPGFATSAMADPASPLTVTKTANPSPVTSGGQLTYTIAIKNTGGAKVDSVVMTDQVNGVGAIQSPPGLPQLTITSTQGPCTQGGANGNVVTCQIGTIPGTASVTITIRGQVTAASGTNLNNTASVSGTKSAQNFTTNASVQVLVQGTSGGGNAPDLTLNKTGPTSVATGGNMDYVLTVNNIGNANTANVKVVDTLPSGVTLQASSFETTSLFTCSTGVPTNPITVTCTGGTVNAGQNATIKIHAIAPGTAGSITNTAIVDPDQAIAESNELNNASATVNTNVTTAPPVQGLTIAKTDGSPKIPNVTWDTGAGPDPVNPGQVLTYKIQVVNTAATRADDVVITDGTQSLEASSIVASQVIANGTLGTTGGCFVNAPQVTCKVRTLNPGGTITLTIQGLVVSTAGASIFNSATVTGNIKNQGVQASASESTTVRPAVDLTITKADSPDPVCARSWPTTANPSADHLGLAGGVPAATGDIPAIGLLTAPAPPVCLGGLTYTFVVGNSGNTPASNVAIRDQLAAGVIFDSYDTDGGFACSVNGTNVVSCTGGSIPAASTRQIRFRVVTPSSLGTLTNSVTVDPNNAIFEPDETNNDATTTTDVRTGIDLVIWKSDKKNVDPPGGALPLAEGFDPIATSGTGTYTIIVDNVGTQDSTGIRVVDTMPAGTKFLSVTADQGFSCSHNGALTGGLVTCFGGHLLGTESEFYDPAGAGVPTLGHDEFATIKIKFFATPFVQQVGQTMHNEVRVDPDNTIAEANELNNLATDDTVVTTGNDDKGAFNQLTIDKTQVSPAANGAVATNGILIYNLHVANLGTDPVSNVEVKDFLPTGSRFISATDITVASPASAKFFCAHDGSATGGTIACIGGDFSGSLNVISGTPVVPIARDIQVKVFAPNTPQTSVNIGTVDPANLVPEGNEFDNDDDQNTTVAPCVGQTDCTNGNAVYELTIKKTKVSPNPDPVARNGIITFDLEVSNLGSDPISGVTVTDRLPAGFRFISASDLIGSAVEAFHCTGPDASGVVTCTGGSLSGQTLPLPSGAPTTRHIRIRVFAPDIPGTYTNNAFVDPSNTIPEGNEFNNQSSIDVAVANGGSGPYIDLTLKKEQIDPDPATIHSVDPGGHIAYSITVSNGGAGDAFNVTVRDALPQFTLFHNARDSVNSTGQFTCGTTSPGILTCTGGTIPAGGSRTILVNVDVASKIDTGSISLGDVHVLITNQATVDPDNTIPEGDETNNSDFVDTNIVPPINLTLTKEGPGAATQNDTVTYTITVTNNKIGNGATATSVKIVDPLPVGLIPLSVEADPGNFTCQVQENPVNLVTCLGDLQTTKHVTITIKAFVTQNGGELDNEACVDPDDTIAESNELDNCKHAIGDVAPTAPDISINKTADKSSVTSGEALTYTLTVSNVGTADAASQISVSDLVPPQLVITGINPDAGWDCSTSSGNQVTCTRDGLPKGGSSHIEVQTTATGDPLTAPFTNTANVIGGGENNANNNTDKVTTSVGGAAIDLNVVSIQDNPDPVNHDDTLTYTTIVRNDGTSGTGPGAVVRLVFPSAGVPVASMSASGDNGFSCSANTTLDPSGRTFDCVGEFGASGTTTDSTTITAQMTVAHTAPPPAQLSLTVTADPDGAFIEADETNNVKSETTTVSGTVCSGSPCVDLLATATGSPIVQMGNSAFYFATVTNVGDAAVPDSPAWSIDLTFTGIGVIGSVIAPPGVSCTPITPLLTRCTSVSGSGDPMDLGPGDSLTFIVQVNSIFPAGSFGIFNVNADSTSKVTELSESNNTGIVVTAITP
jgi:uncharacterized repeat protein (TIGR01451 family)